MYWIIGSFVVGAILIFHMTTEWRYAPGKDTTLDNLREMYFAQPSLVVVVLVAAIVASWVTWPLYLMYTVRDFVKARS